MRRPDRRKQIKATGPWRIWPYKAWTSSKSSPGTTLRGVGTKVKPLLKSCFCKSDLGSSQDKESTEQTQHLNINPTCTYKTLNCKKSCINVLHKNLLWCSSALIL
ncbi:hypothetical protein Q7C36_016113 [Tachysurus vachellii]|uniref:Uncharacterized protein n=1 Tax=Tachysurus vachellii TaxID=175792 RepID=A0AA88SAE8_TACVA|nr:hypothetical protein Q7C36_016113 [Tachysurus vachellii]